MRVKTEVITMLSKLTDTQREVYFFMFKKYGELTQTGDNYMGSKVEDYDSLVAGLAAEKFNLSTDDVGKIYVDIETDLSKI